VLSATRRSIIDKETTMTEVATNVPVTEAKSAVDPAPGAGVPHWEWWPFESWRREVERAFDDLQRGPWRLPFTRAAFDASPVWPGEFLWRAMPAVEIVEGERDYVITAEMPGVPADSVEVDLSDNRLTLAGEKREEQEVHKKDIRLSERRYGSFRRTFRIPENVERSEIAASFKNGVLTIKLPKAAETQPSGRKIEVQSA
jgi:HSP20 family protein